MPSPARRRYPVGMQVERSIEVHAPVRNAYNRWTQLETLPEVVDDVCDVRQVDDGRLHWRARVAGGEVHGVAIITEQVPDEMFAWRAAEGPPHRGRVDFSPHGDDRCEVTIRLDVDVPAGAIGDRLGRALEAFRTAVERRTATPRGWRGQIEDEAVVSRREGADQVTEGQWGAAERDRARTMTQAPADDSGRRAGRKHTPGTPGLADEPRGPQVADDQGVPSRDRDRGQPEDPTERGGPTDPRAPVRRP
jgi:hypothetical protein